MEYLCRSSKSHPHLEPQQRRSYHRINRINNTGPSNKGPSMCNYSPTNRTPISINLPEGILIQGPLRASYARDPQPFEITILKKGYYSSMSTDFPSDQSISRTINAKKNQDCI
ncbi:hypothetical protein TNCV_3971961 [Trichonephila clavipes]|nr:hypothetical protein TNCV_3971961 [Trichonephila clavipes]